MKFGVGLIRENSYDANKQLLLLWIAKNADEQGGRRDSSPVHRQMNRNPTKCRFCYQLSWTQDFHLEVTEITKSSEDREF